jgi:hypothetical protein
MSSIVQIESPEFMFNLTIMRKDWNTSEIKFKSNHEDEGGVFFYGVVQRYDSWFFREFNGSELFK